MSKRIYILAIAGIFLSLTALLYLVMDRYTSMDFITDILDLGNYKETVGAFFTARLVSYLIALAIYLVIFRKRLSPADLRWYNLPVMFVLTMICNIDMYSSMWNVVTLFMVLIPLNGLLSILFYISYKYITIRAAKYSIILPIFIYIGIYVIIPRYFPVTGFRFSWTTRYLTVKNVCVEYFDRKHKSIQLDDFRKKVGISHPLSVGRMGDKGDTATAIDVGLDTQFFLMYKSDSLKEYYVQHGKWGAFNSSQYW
jgi:hypothetical protein